MKLAILKRQRSGLSRYCWRHMMKEWGGETGSSCRASRTTGSVIISLKAVIAGAYTPVDFADGILSSGYSPELTISDSGDKHVKVFNTPDWWFGTETSLTSGAGC